MGMFDTVCIEYPLPDPRFQHCEFQTKDMASLLGVYTLTKTGVLMYTMPNWVGGDEEPTERVADIVGTINFYAYQPLPGVSWVEFKMVIVDGKLHHPIEKVRLEYENGTIDWVDD
jgi:hypothetical protein